MPVHLSSPRRVLSPARATTLDLTPAAATPRSRPRSVRRFVASLGAAGIGQAPERARVWRSGPNPWDGGVVNLTPKAARAVLDEFLRRGNPLSMDIEHGISLAEQQARAEGKVAPETPLVTAGYCTLELVGPDDAPELWFVARWSDCGRPFPEPEKVCCAKHQIESGQRCEISPDWDGDPETGEQIRINRISLVLDGATHGISLLASRAAAERTAMAGEMDGCRAAHAYAKQMAASEDPEAKKLGEAMCAHLALHAAALGVKLEGEPDGDEPVAKGATAAEPPPEPKGKEDEIPKPAVAAAPALASRPAAQPLTLTVVLDALADRDELHRILDINKDRIPEGHRRMLASRGLAAAREYVEGLPPRAAPAGTNGDTGGPTTEKVKPWKRALNEAERYFAARVRSALGVTEAMEKDFENRVDDDGGVTISMVDLVDRHRAARLKTRSAA